MDIEKLSYILHHFEFDICELIEEVFNDSEDDPHYSAVTASNMIKCYKQVSEDIGVDVDFHDVKEFILHRGYSEKDYETFENHRKKESQYYVGPQF